MIPELRENSEGKLEKWMQKEKFYVRLEDKLAEDEGYIDKEHGIAFSDNESLIWNENKWTATDIETGCKITNGNTFDSCYENVLAMWDQINERRKSKEFDIFKSQFQMILNGTLGSGIVTLEQDYI